MKVHLNPIVKKDLRVSARSMRMSWGLFGYEALLTVAFLLAMAVIQSESNYLYNSKNIYSYLIYLFPVLAVSQVCVVALIMPILTASSISGERERQTFDIMLTTCMSPFSIVFGKVLSATIRILFFVMASLPIMALSFVVGGMSWGYLFLFLLTIVLLCFCAGSIGIFCSSVCNKSVSAVVLSFVFYGIIGGGTSIPILLCMLITGADYAWESMLLLLFNPVFFFVEFFVWSMTGNTLMEEVYRGDVGPITYGLAQTHTWILVSAICILALSFFFMYRAAWHVDPMHASGKRKKKKRSAE